MKLALKITLAVILSILAGAYYVNINTTIIAPISPETTYPQSTTTSTLSPPVELSTQTDNDSNVAFNNMRKEADNILHRWNTDSVTVNVQGLQEGQNLKVITDLVEVINGLGVYNIPVIMLSEQTSKVHMYSAPKSEWRAILGPGELKEEADGITRTIWEDDGTLVSAKVAVNSESHQWQRNRTIVHEFLHALGLGHHQCASGILDDSSTYSPNWSLTKFDIRLIRMQYANSAELAELAKDPEPCVSVAWQTLNDTANQKVLWCALSAEDNSPVAASQPCQYASGDVEPTVDAKPVAWVYSGSLYYYNPELYTRRTYKNKEILCETKTENSYLECSVAVDNKFSEVTLWLMNEVLYTYNPELYTRFDYEGSSILCYKVNTSERQGCQYTDKSYINAIDVWTDGVRIYESKN